MIKFHAGKLRKFGMGFNQKFLFGRSENSYLIAKKLCVDECIRLQETNTVNLRKVLFYESLISRLYHCLVVCGVVVFNHEISGVGCIHKSDFNQPKRTSGLSYTKRIKSREVSKPRDLCLKFLPNRFGV